jgi:solute carrier family 50 protein (sugar transporter)
MGLANCIIWIIYSTIIKNYFVFCANFMGVILLSSYSLTAIALLSRNPSEANAKSVMLLEKILILMITIYVFVALIVGIVLSGGDDAGVISNLVGTIALVVNIFYYAAPCSTLLRCIRTKNAESMLVPLLCANFTNATLWFFYGLIGLNDPYIYVPNILGMLFATVSLIVKFMFPGTKPTDPHIVNEHQQQSSQTPYSRSFDGVENSNVAAHSMMHGNR